MPSSSGCTGALNTPPFMGLSIKRITSGRNRRRNASACRARTCASICSTLNESRGDSGVKTGCAASALARDTLCKYTCEPSRPPAWRCDMTAEEAEEDDESGWAESGARWGFSKSLLLGAI